MFAIAVNDIIWHELDNLREIHHDRSIDILGVVESRHSVESVIISYFSFLPSHFSSMEQMLMLMFMSSFVGRYSN